MKKTISITEIMNRFGENIWWKATLLDVGESFEFDYGEQNDIRVTKLDDYCNYSVEILQVNKNVHQIICC